MKAVVCLLITVLTLSAEPPVTATENTSHTQLLITQLGDADFYVREQSMVDLVRTSPGNDNTAVKALLTAEKSPQPEIKARAAVTLELIYMRRHLGRGSPKHGLSFKPKLVTINKKLRTRPLIDKITPNSPAVSSQLKPGDFILSINDVHFASEDSVKEITTYLNKQQEGATLEIRYSRKIEGKRVVQQATLTLGKPGNTGKHPELKPDELAGYHSWHRNMLKLLHQ